MSPCHISLYLLLKIESSEQLADIGTKLNRSDIFLYLRSRVLRLLVSGVCSVVLVRVEVPHFSMMLSTVFSPNFPFFLNNFILRLRIWVLLVEGSVKFMNLYTLSLTHNNGYILVCVTYNSDYILVCVVYSITAIYLFIFFDASLHRLLYVLCCVGYIFHRIVPRLERRPESHTFW